MMSQQKVFYFCYDHQQPTGGQKQMYRHVDILNKNGYESYIVHTQKGFRLTWFENTTRVTCWEMFKKKLYNQKTDFTVFPEDLGEQISAFPGRKIIFNQNVYHGFDAFGFNKINKWPYLDKGVKFVMTVSSHNEVYLKFIFPDMRIRRIYNGVDLKKFIYKPISQKERLITMLPQKAVSDNIFLYQAISARAKQGLNNLGRYKWQFVGMHSEIELTRIFAKTLIFIFLSQREGCPLMPLEAMLSGALVVTYGGGPYSEYLNSSDSFLLDASDKLGVIKIVEDIAKKFESKRKDLTLLSQKAYETARRYSLEREEKSVLKFWKEVLHA